MIQQTFVANLKSELYYQGVGSEKEISLAVLNVSEGITELRVETLKGIIACSRWETVYHNIQHSEVDVYDYFISVAPKFRNLKEYQIDYYLRDTYLVIVLTQSCPCA